MGKPEDNQAPLEGLKYKQLIFHWANLTHGSQYIRYKIFYIISSHEEKY